MSFWWYGRKEGGKRSLWAIDTDPMLVVTVIVFLAIIVGLNLLNHPWIPFVLVLGGLACLIIAKISLYRQGIWLSSGPALMSKGYAGLYKVAYILMGVGLLFMLLLLTALRRV